jgi:SAM-dependent methyltransferase
MLKDSQDAFGYMVYDCLTGKDAHEIIERDDGLVEVTRSSYFSEFKNWLSHQKRAMRYVRGRVLDIGSGAGRHSLYLQEKGHEVLGIDNSPLALEVCRLRGLKNTELLPITEINSRLGIFDTVLMMGNNFGLFGDFDKARRLLKRLNKITSERGRIIAETIDVYQTEVPEHLSYHERNRRGGRMAGQIRLRVRYRTYATPWFDYLMVSKEEMADILDSTYWKIARFIDSDGPMYVAILDKR